MIFFQYSVQETTRLNSPDRQYNLRARDYNATLPDRDTPIMPLKNPQTGHIIPEFLNEDTEKPLTIQALECLSGKPLWPILFRLPSSTDQQTNVPRTF